MSDKHRVDFSVHSELLFIDIVQHYSLAPHIFYNTIFTGVNHVQAASLALRLFTDIALFLGIVLSVDVGISIPGKLCRNIADNLHNA